MSQVKTVKKSYEKPEVVYRQSMESVAAVCDTGSGGKFSGTSCSRANS